MHCPCFFTRRHSLSEGAFRVDQNCGHIQVKQQEKGRYEPYYIPYDVLEDPRKSSSHQWPCGTLDEDAPHYGTLNGTSGVENLNKGGSAPNLQAKIAI